MSLNDSSLHNCFLCYRHQTTESVIFHAEINPTTDVTIYEDVIDNRDLDIYESWDPSEK